MDQTAIFRHARALQQARSVRELALIAARATRAVTRYPHSWVCLFEEARPGFARIIAMSEEMSASLAEPLVFVPIAGDEMMLELQRSEAVVVVVDARTDPRTNKAIVEQVRNRTIINVPMLLETKLLGALGVGTLGDEPCLEPTPQELEALIIFAMQLAAALERVRSDEREQQFAAERQLIERRLESLQRLELMGVMSSGVAHDLNNMLAVVQSNLDVLASGPDDDALADARTAVARAGQVCGQLLSLGRVKASQRVRIDLNARVEAALRLVRPAIPRGIRLVHEPHPHPAIDGDPVQLDQALANLILNARDAVGADGVISVVVDGALLDERAVAMTSWARAGQFARVSVRDSGAGIPAALLEHIFEPLFTTKTNGTGLGLAVVSRVVQQHSGLVRCESQPGLTNFEVYLPGVA